MFEKGTSLQQLWSQWPQGMLQFHVERKEITNLGLPQGPRYHCEVCCGTLLKDGPFAVVLVKENADLRSLIDIDHHELITDEDFLLFIKEVACIVLHLEWTGCTITAFFKGTSKHL